MWRCGDATIAARWSLFGLLFTWSFNRVPIAVLELPLDSTLDGNVDTQAVPAQHDYDGVKTLFDAVVQSTTDAA
jgi:hypothetical protein